MKKVLEGPLEIWLQDGGVYQSDVTIDGKELDVEIGEMICPKSSEGGGAPECQAKRVRITIEVLEI